MVSGETRPLLPPPALYSCTVLYCAVLCPAALHRPDSVVVSASAVKQVAAATLRGTAPAGPRSIESEYSGC